MRKLSCLKGSDASYKISFGAQSGVALLLNSFLMLLDP